MTIASIKSLANTFKNYLQKKFKRPKYLHEIHPCFTTDDYFQKLFSKNRNFASLTFEEGLTAGEFKDIKYVIKIHPKNLIESFVYLKGGWETHLIDLISSYLNERESTFIDIGANIGATSIPLAKYHPQTDFQLFEPHPLLFKNLCDNISFNKLSNVTAHNFAITNSSEKSLPFYAQKNSDNLGLSSFKKNYDIDEHDVIDVKCLSIDDAFEKHNVPIRVIKIDTQGSELQVLLSAKNTIKRYKPVIFFEFESEYFEDKSEEKMTKDNILNLLTGLDYELYMLSAEQVFFPKVNLSSYFHGEIIAVPKA